MPFPKVDLTVNGLTVFCEALGESAYWMRNENIVVIFNESAIGEESVIVGEISYDNAPYTSQEIAAALVEIRRANQ